MLIAPGAFAQSARPNASATPSANAPTSIEQALIEHACLSQLPGVAGEDAYQACLTTKLGALRADFGRDLSRISVGDRKALDASCSAMRQAEGREAYLECLAVQLTSIRKRSANGAASEDGALLSTPANVQSTILAAPQQEASSSISRVWIGVTLVALVVAGGAAVMAVKTRRATRKCRVCGDDVPGAGDLCPKCRHEAAEALRQAAAERADHERAQAEEQRQAREREEELRLQRARENEDARLRQEANTRQREEEVRRREKELEETRQRGRAAAVETEDVFDPYAILGVPRDASNDVIEAACQAARLKYAPEQVAHLGSELQEHYRRKAAAVERAFEILSE
jgi:hypothetical protein